MDSKKKLYSMCMFLIVCCLTMGIMIGCSDDKDEMEQSLYGYVQFKIYKGASFDDFANTRSIDKLNFLNDAKKNRGCIATRWGDNFTNIGP